MESKDIIWVPFLDKHAAAGFTVEYLQSDVL
jgi:hypothetical protein